MQNKFAITMIKEVLPVYLKKFNQGYRIIRLRSIVILRYFHLPRFVVNFNNIISYSYAKWDPL